jgi:hemerythrin-like domain-containing protein
VTIIRLPSFAGEDDEKEPVLSPPVLRHWEKEWRHDWSITAAHAAACRCGRGLGDRGDDPARPGAGNYESTMRRLGQGEDIDPAVLEASARIVLEFIHDHHEKQEEELVFPRFKSAGRMVELVNVFVVQHAAGRKLTDRILAAAPQARNRQPREAMAPDIQAFIILYRPHMAREETDLYPTLRHLVTSDEHQEIANQLERNERQAFGADGFEKVAKKVHEIEKSIGLGDLDLFTPKG